MHIYFGNELWQQMVALNCRFVRFVDDVGGAVAVAVVIYMTDLHSHVFSVCAYVSFECHLSVNDVKNLA